MPEFTSRIVDLAKRILRLDIAQQGELMRTCSARVYI